MAGGEVMTRLAAWMLPAHHQVSVRVLLWEAPWGRHPASADLAAGFAFCSPSHMTHGTNRPVSTKSIE